ncbi:MAG: pyridoxal phosphate-dependent aminotransferase [Terriglobia bacterium]
MNVSPAELPLAERMSRLGTEGAFEVLARAKQLEAQGKDIVHLEIGEPDFPTAPHIVEAGVQALRDGWTHYGPSVGLAELREAVAEDAGKRRGIRIDPAEVIITPGAKPIFFFAVLAVVGPEDEVLYPDPGFPIYESMIRFVGAKPVPYPLREENDFDVAAAAILERLSSHTRLVILNSPQNPSGGVMAPAELRILASELQKHDLFIFSDEIYSRLIFEGSPASIAQFAEARERTIILDGFSKSYAMTGWRLGYGVMNPTLVAEMTRLMINSNSCTATFTQRAGIAALRGDQTCVDRMVEEFRRRRTVIVEGLNSIPGFHCRQAHGAFYAFPNVRGTGMKSRELADALLRDAGVACLPGTAFGESGEGYLRFSFANSVENINKALGRIDCWVRSNVTLNR